MSHYDVLTSLTLLTVLAAVPAMGMVSFRRKRKNRPEKEKGAGQQ